MNATISKLILFGVTVISIITMFSFPAIPQDPYYHDFADNRMFFQMENFADVVSNFGLLLVSLIGFCVLILRKHTGFINQGERYIWLVYFFGIFLTAFGSAWYHLNPNNETLVWDRLPMTISFMSFFAIIMVERIDYNVGIMFFPILIVIGISSVLYWYYTESIAAGDLRFYGLVQFLPLVLFLLILMLYDCYYDASHYLLFGVGYYGLSKIAEHYDQEIFQFTIQMISGHTIKHLLIAMGVYMVICYLRKRKFIVKHA